MNEPDPKRFLYGLMNVICLYIFLVLKSIDWLIEYVDTGNTFIVYKKFVNGEFAHEVNIDFMLYAGAFLCIANLILLMRGKIL